MKPVVVGARQNLSVTTLEDLATNLTLLGGDLESPVTFSILASPTNGLLSNLDATAGTVRYRPGTNFFGADGFTFLVSDGVLQATGAVSVTVVPVNDRPLAPGLIVEVLEETAVSLQLTGSDVEGPMRFAIAGGPVTGILSNFNTNTGSVTYTAPAGYEGPDPFTYSVSDGALSATGLRHLDSPKRTMLQSIISMLI